MLSRGAAKDSKFMLDADDVRRGCIDPPGGFQVIHRLVLPDGEADFLWIIVMGAFVGHGDHVTGHGGIGGRQRFANVGCEGGDAAAPRRIISDQDHTLDFRRRPGGLGIISDKLETG